tara:strand:+ start:685 stop:1095 length:411 start_codon:yes stop_codon:yes gene_type:complete
MEKKRVVTSFLLYNSLILILKRSSHVKTMKGRWAGVSGYIEGEEDPLDRALKEISEEVGLEKESLILIKRGEPVDSLDTIRKDVVWVVTPFLFRVNSPQIQIDWEHEDYRWVSVDEIKDFETIPGLMKTLKRVLPD